MSATKVLAKIVLSTNVSIEKDRLVSDNDEAFNDFEVVTKLGKADLILGIL
ncbi:3013_t:CDS:2 [Funneliformis mosseae]|uniref:3013_t:CDS:1 n=1 Tax=Funneliformis mosseae TaxID=27381 RepID=A0A9N8ZRL4_FUNMO|nr:3013_t:CDS:2 [Funneliformis mosseae]